MESIDIIMDESITLLERIEGIFFLFFARTKNTRNEQSFFKLLFKRGDIGIHQFGGTGVNMSCNVMFIGCLNDWL